MIEKRNNISQREVQALLRKMGHGVEYEKVTEDGLFSLDLEVTIKGVDQQERSVLAAAILCCLRMASMCSTRHRTEHAFTTASWLPQHTCCVSSL
jgi:hypothetical protein